MELRHPTTVQGWDEILGMKKVSGRKKKRKIAVG